MLITFACRIVVHLWITIQLFCFKYWIRGAAAKFVWSFESPSKKERAQTIIACSFKNLHAFFYCGPRKPVIIRRIDSWQDGDVDTKRLRSKFPGFTYSLSKGLWWWLAKGGEDTWLKIECRKKMLEVTANHLVPPPRRLHSRAMGNRPYRR